VSTAAVLYVFAVGAALVGFWAVARFSSFGPQTLRGALVATGAALVLESQLPALVSRMANSAGAAAALVLVVLPALTILFWTSGCLVRSLIALIAPHRP
jgi:hypothetical protein